MNTDFCTDSRKCPLCRTQSDFVTPSQLWVETQEEKVNLIQGYKTALKSVSLCRSDSASSFKAALKTHLFNNYF